MYVRSWRDSGDDGVGDLAGACEGLDYLQWLGIDAIWLSPTMPSPNTDWGYDVSDYYGVDPALGALDNLDNLIAEARKRDIAIMLDLVPNHSSSEHPWFIDAATGRQAGHRDYYVWADGKPDGGPPNNWVAATGKSAWSYDETSGQYYVHNFLPTQPDLNWWHEPVHQEFERVLHYWYDRGVAGFRIDVAHGLYKDALLRDNPPSLPTDHRATGQGGLRHVYNANRPEVHDVYKRWRQISDSYDPQRALLGEVWELDLERFGDYYGRGTPELHMAFNFLFVEADLKARDLAAIVESTVAALPPGGTAVWTASNHDVGRFPTRWCDNDQRAVRAALVLLATLPGTLVLYYGDELGMVDVYVPVEQRLDEMTRDAPGNPGRDRCRTPMPWSAEKNAGFTTATAHPWLPLGDHSTTNVQSERADPGSVLNLVRELAMLRRSGQIGQPERLERVLLDDQVWAFRVNNATTIANLSPEEVTREVPLDGVATVIASTQPRLPGKKVTGEVNLGPWEAIVLGS
jgi:alpha-glucosidase